MQQTEVLKQNVGALRATLEGRAFDGGPVSACRADTVAAHRRAVERVISDARERLCEPISLRDMSRVAYISPFHFNRVFHEITGLPPAKFISAMRLDRAKRLLLNTHLSITEICYEVGYNSLGTFTRRFTELVGLGPREFRYLAERITPASVESLCAHYAELSGRSMRHSTVSGVEGFVDACGPASELAERIDLSARPRPDAGPRPGAKPRLGPGSEPSAASRLDAEPEPSAASRLGAGSEPSAASRLGAGSEPNAASRLGAGSRSGAGPIFVGLFPAHIPQSRPLGGTLLPSPGPFRIGPVPDGTYHLLAAALPRFADTLSYLLPDTTNLFVGAGNGPVIVRAGRASGHAQISLRPMTLTDPPLLVSLPFLLADTLK